MYMPMYQNYAMKSISTNMLALKTETNSNHPKTVSNVQMEELTSTIHSIIVVEVEAPFFELRLVLDAGPEEDA